MLIARSICHNFPSRSVRIVCLRYRSRRSKNISKKVELLSENTDKAPIYRRMLDLVLGAKAIPRRTRSQKFLFGFVYLTVILCYWYWLLQVERYKNEILIERETLEYDKKGKLVETKEFTASLEASPQQIGAMVFRQRDKLEQLEKEIREFKAERKVLESSRQIDSKLDSER